MGGRSRLAALAAGACLLLLLGAPAADEVDDLIDGVEAVVERVAEAATDAFSGRFASVADCGCSPHACGSEFGTSECVEDIGDAELCGGCTGQKLSLAESFILTPPTVDIKNLTADVKDSICTFQGLNTVFNELQNNLTANAWSYVATTTGIMRNWPGHAHDRGVDVDAEDADSNLEDCKIYDPRVRPWYAAATSGPKDVVLVVDTSESMLVADSGDSTTRWDVAKQALLSLLDTFSISDYINMVEFNDEVKSLSPGGLLHATSDNIAALKEEVNVIEPKGGTDFRLGLEEAFSLLTIATKRRKDNEELVSSDCQKVIIFVTAGEDCTLDNGKECGKQPPENVTPVDAVLDFIEEKQQALVAAGSQRVHFFPYSFGADADDEIPKEMACANEGVWGRILPGDDPLFKMNTYTAYLASQRGNTKPIWSRVYVDEFGLGAVVTAAKAIYSPKTSLGEDGSLVGVVGHDVRVGDIEAITEDFRTVILQIVRRGIQCIDTVFTGCELQLLRGQESECPEKFEPADCYFFSTTGAYYSAPKEPLLSYDDAEAFCKEMGGELADINQPLEEDLLAGLASNAGSWIGLKRDESGTWKWTVTGEAVPEDSVIWVFNKDLEDPEKSCATLDRRGVRNSVHPESCSLLTRPICKFSAEAAPDQCTGDNVIRIDEDYVYNVRPLSTCRTEEEDRVNATAISPGVEDFAADDVICPLGTTKSTFDVRCCDDCTA
ncbi:unnamed protein product [Ostreobium quekettii]|uniref:C-type lectin n=1 Tax=Ostreobium quekettii TaxID=121088 RepID=A0A8S1IMG5_9CHLO|nr:unnamed protein product [Ostreobium quekettii]